MNQKELIQEKADFIKNWLLKNFKNGALSDLTSNIKIQTIRPNNDKIYQISYDRRLNRKNRSCML